MSGSTMLNLSLLTSDMWAVCIRIFAYHEKVDWMYYVAFAAVAVGLVIYSGGAKEEEERAQIAGDGNQLQKERDEEAGLDTTQGSAVDTQRMGDGKVRSSSNPSPAVAEAVPIDSKNAENP